MKPTSNRAYRGEYYQLDAKHNQVVNHLIYPIPDPELPFLGVHLTRMIDGSVTVGPNAVQGWSERLWQTALVLKTLGEDAGFAGFGK